ncbi:LysE/ArgO family amino acid transporter [Parasulfitobacter algicola]|uniref:Amino acid transporter n=1 Tax=Parasulfitobacter algicola TaxID=2614809 RepID=A0ABX2IZ91_9RHOB|nr:LysE/ArgO family amino acid transporter [Sulfitobacter algicola]NSX56542.1 amino acid transporter [Sulfitobacter algicola]
MIKASFIPGFILGLSLIMAIGAQNAFVLRQGLRRAHVFAVCLTCAASDAILITAGVAGFGVLTESAPWLVPVARFGGAAFLFIYGLISFRAAWKGGETLAPSADKSRSLKAALATCLALTWLNPHVYLDTVILLGSVSSNYDNTVAFGAGAVTASFCFFFVLGYGARLLTPLFAKEIAWRILDVIVGLIMWFIAVKLIWLQ